MFHNGIDSIELSVLRVFESNLCLPKLFTMANKARQDNTHWDGSNLYGYASSLPSKPASRNEVQDITQTTNNYYSGDVEKLGTTTDTQRWNQSPITVRFLGDQSHYLQRPQHPNSLDNFVHSVQRVAHFRDSIPIQDQDGRLSEGANDSQNCPSPPGTQQRSLLTEQIRAASQGLPNTPCSSILVEDIDRGIGEQLSEVLLDQHIATPTQSLLDKSITGHCARFGYGSITSNASIPHKCTFKPSQECLQIPADVYDEIVADECTAFGGLEPTVVLNSETTTRIGGSTVPMTIFNSVNVMLGVGILTLPYSFQQAGFIMGTLMMVSIGLVTKFTAILLARCMDVSPATRGYGDIAFLAFGKLGSWFVEAIFMLELMMSNVALIILFGDSVHSLIPTVSKPLAQAVIAIGVLPLNLVPIRYLSLTSVLGICCIIGTMLLVFVNGLLKTDGPGSLWTPSGIQALPKSGWAIASSFGLFMAPLGGHPIFPAIYRDMRHPHKYQKAVRTTYSFTFGLNTTMIALGCLMFGHTVCNEVTRNILDPMAGYPRTMSVLIMLLIGVVPITKMPLANQPTIDIINRKCFSCEASVETPGDLEKPTTSHLRSHIPRIGRVVSAIAVNAIQLSIAYIVPDFDAVMILIGSILCVTTCVVLPITFYLRIFWSVGTITAWEKAWLMGLVAASAALGVAGVVGTSTGLTDG